MIDQTLSNHAFTTIRSAIDGCQINSSETRCYSDEIELIQHLLNVGQTLCEQKTESAHILCREISRLTHQQVQLSLGQDAFHRFKAPDSALFTLPVRFQNTMYGVLYVISDAAEMRQQPLPLPVAKLIAQMCGWLLYTVEQSDFIQGQCQQLPYKVQVSITKREREVLFLMFRRYDEESIAESLHISITTVRKHRQHIYEQLGVHNERDALFVAYQTGIFSIIGNYAQVNNESAAKNIQ